MSKNKIVSNASWIIGCKIVQSLLSFVVSLMCARYLGPANYGIIQYASSLVVFVTPFMTLGFTNILVHEFISEKTNEGEILGTTLLSSFFSAILCMIGILFFVFIANAGETLTICVCILFSISLIFSAIELTQYWFHSKLLAKYTSVVALISYIIVSAFRIYLLVTSKSVYWFAIAYAFDVMLIAGALLLLYKRLGGQKLSFSFNRLKKMFGKSRYFIISSVMVTFMVQSDRIMLNLMIGNEATGYYSAAAFCAGMTSFVFAAIADSFRPVIFENRLNNYEAYELNIKRLYNVMIYFSLIQCVVITLFADIIIKITYGLEYAPAITALQIAVWYTTFSYLGVVRNIWILAEGKEKYLWIINLFGAVTNIVLNFILIPIWGINGAAFASLVTQMTTNVVIGFILRPIRYNNKLMLQSLNPYISIDLMRKFLKRV